MTEAKAEHSQATSETTGGSTLLSIREHELRACPETPEHQAVCLSGSAHRMMQLGFQLPEKLRKGQRMACKAVMLTAEDDVLFLLKCVLDDYERLREERDGLRASEKEQRHEAGRMARRAASLDRKLAATDKRLADAEYRLEEAERRTDGLRAEARREAQRARIAESQARRTAETAKHRERRTERELFEARQRLERSNTSPVGRRTQPLYKRRSGGGSGGGQPGQLKAQHAVRAVPASQLFETLALPTALLAPKSTVGAAATAAATSSSAHHNRPGRNRSLPTMGQRQIWYRVPAEPAAAEEVHSARSRARQPVRAQPVHFGVDGRQAQRRSHNPMMPAAAGVDPGAQSVISLAETIDVSGGFGGIDGCSCAASTDAFSVASSASVSRLSSKKR